MMRKYGATVMVSIGVALWLVALYLLASAAQNSAAFDRWLPWILLRMERLIRRPGLAVAATVKKAVLERVEPDALETTQL